MLLKIRGGRVNLLLLARERSRELLLCEGFRDKVVVIKAKARSGLKARQGRECVSSATSLDT